MRWTGSADKKTAGMEITPGRIRYALVHNNGAERIVTKMADVKIPSGSLVPSFKTENITDMGAVQNCLKQAGRMIPSKTIHAVLPDACTKTMIRKFRELPRDPREINSLVLWNMAAACNLPPERLRISWKHMGQTPDNAHVFLVVMGMTQVIAQYEALFSGAGIRPASLTPAGLSRFNLFAPALPETGNTAFLTLFDDAVHLLVFSNGLPLFYRMIRKGLLNPDSTSAIDDMDLLVHCYAGEYPGHEIDIFYIVSQIKYHAVIAQIFQELGDTPFVMLDEVDFVLLDDSIKISPDNNPLPFFSAVLGAGAGQVSGN